MCHIPCAKWLSACLTVSDLLLSPSISCRTALQLPNLLPATTSRVLLPCRCRMLWSVQCPSIAHHDRAAPSVNFPDRNFTRLPSSNSNLAVPVFQKHWSCCHPRPPLRFHFPLPQLFTSFLAFDAAVKLDGSSSLGTRCFFQVSRSVEHLGVGCGCGL
ncbi:hypothetical protein BDP81DRAFT_1339 [Colletotrichum phormii]|uniref:Secreted protein n=1 Tax=Colletotrichum phormii TaxID=359342 RepID=A0AAJ0A2G0_9PEZI|nr:uncharacterized protein BDP81DRAFT_1339 [Colletotrichum phormii]KAK1655235.1 hypothetical protein BDP81DRAFT_1339 [Colletotrichum phormii]